MPNIATDGDRAFVGVDERRDPGQLEPGLLARGVNLDLTNQDGTGRKAFQAPFWAASGSFSFPFDFDLNFNELVGHGELLGSDVFANKFGEKFFIHILPRFAVIRHESGSETVLNYPDDAVLADKVELKQAFQEVYLWRGKSLNPWVWTGNEKDDFVEVPRENLGAGVKAIPRSGTPTMYYLERTWVLEDRDSLFFSDIGNAKKYSIANQFKIDTGSFKTVTRFLPFGQAGIIIFLDTGMQFIDNLVGADLVANGVRSVLSNQIGCPAPDTAVDCGEDILFLSERGVFTVRQALDNRLRANSEPLSAPLNPVFSRINWAQKRNFRAVYFNNQYLLAVALDDSTVNNAIIVYSFITKTWHGWHEADFLDVERFYSITLNRIQQLFSIDNAGVPFRMYNGNDDEPLGGPQGIMGTLISRGYGARDMERKRFQRVHVDESENCASWDILVKTDGVNEFQQLDTNIMRDRTKYKTMFSGRFKPDNSDLNHGDPHREDYSVRLDGQAVFFPFNFPFDFRSPATPGGTYELCIDGEGVNPDHLQRFEEKRIVNRTGDYMQVCINKHFGRQVIHAIRVKFVERNQTSLSRT